MPSGGFKVSSSKKKKFQTKVYEHLDFGAILEYPDAFILGLIAKIYLKSKKCAVKIQLYIKNIIRLYSAISLFKAAPAMVKGKSFVASLILKFLLSPKEVSIQSFIRFLSKKAWAGLFEAGG